MKVESYRGKPSVPLAVCAVAVVLLACAAGEAAAAEAGDTVAIEVILDIHDMTYGRQGEAVVDRIVAGDFSAADKGILGLRTLKQPQALVVAEVHNAIGIAYGASGRFEAGVAHLEKALGVDHDISAAELEADSRAHLAYLAVESRAYLVYLLAASARFEAAEKQLGAREIKLPWLYAKLAAAYAGFGHYDCAVANAERALRIGRATSLLVPYGARPDATGTIDREAVLRDWSDHLSALRRKTTSSTLSGGTAPTICVGRQAESPEESAGESIGEQG